MAATLPSRPYTHKSLLDRPERRDYKFILGGHFSIWKSVVHRGLGARPAQLHSASLPRTITTPKLHRAAPDATTTPLAQCHGAPSVRYANRTCGLRTTSIRSSHYDIRKPPSVWEAPPGTTRRGALRQFVPWPCRRLRLSLCGLAVPLRPQSPCM
ncbi:hypothetical protein E2C01_085583 [Portunus trituberculatus]|uniref:Uncharacterized protein n=1 Tax=Portunus trituberculatus TaxID=210409 RepID=A0A5B7JCB7_PORTR|nr:hypothetical protein [Portunus trituberculatus]